MISAYLDPRSKIVTAGRTVPGDTLQELVDTLVGALASLAGAPSPIGIWVEDAANFAACILAARAMQVDAFLIAAGTPVGRVHELCVLEGASTVLCDRSGAASLRGGSHRPAAAGIEVVEVSHGRVHSLAVEPSVHFFTSGTDGHPKGVVRTRAALELEDSTVGPHLGMAAECTVVCTVPVTHGFGFTAGFFAPLSVGGTSIVARPRLASSLAEMLQRHRPDVVVAVPAQYAAWAKLRSTYDGPLPRIWLCGSAPLPPAVRTRFADAWGSTIAEQYGASECGAISVDLDGTESLGRPYPGVTVTIDGGDSPGAQGEIVVNSPYGASGYVGGSPDQVGPFAGGGFRTGDQGWFDSARRLHLVGRRSHQLNVRGQKVDPAEVERALWVLAGVQDVAVLGVDRPDGDQWVAAFVVCADDVPDEALRQATAHLEGYKRPQRMTRLAALPKTATGKTDVPALREMARSNAAV